MYMSFMSRVKRSTQNTNFHISSFGKPNILIVKSIIYLGHTPKKIESAFKSFVEDIIVVNTMKDAVRSSYINADSGDTVLLSPACASFDLFSNYEERGNAFKSSVLEI